MKNSGKHVACTLLIGLMIPASSPAHGQESTTVPSLGEVARQLKSEREKERQEPAPLYTNDNLPSPKSLGASSVQVEQNVPNKKPAEQTGIPADGSADEHGEKYFRSKAEQLRSRLEFHHRQLAVLEQQLGLARVQYYPDPQKTLEQESTPAFQTDLDKLRAKIAAAEKAIADDQKALDDLQQELRRDGGNPGWLR